MSGDPKDFSDLINEARSWPFDSQEERDLFERYNSMNRDRLAGVLMTLVNNGTIESMRTIVRERYPLDYFIKMLTIEKNALEAMTHHVRHPVARIKLTKESREIEIEAGDLSVDREEYYTQRLRNLYSYKSFMRTIVTREDFQHYFDSIAIADDVFSIGEQSIFRAVGEGADFGQAEKKDIESVSYVNNMLSKYPTGNIMDEGERDRDAELCRKDPQVMFLWYLVGFSSRIDEWIQKETKDVNDVDTISISNHFSEYVDYYRHHFKAGESQIEKLKQLFEGLVLFRGTEEGDFLKSPNLNVKIKISSEPRKFETVASSPASQSSGDTDEIKGSSSPAGDEADRAQNSKKSLRSISENNPAREQFIFLQRIAGIEPGMNIVEAGRQHPHLSLAVVMSGAHYIGYSLDPDWVRSHAMADYTSVEDYNVGEFGGSISSRLGEFSSGQKSRSKKELLDHSQDMVFITTGAMSDPTNKVESDPKEVFREALRVIKPKGKLILGTVGDWEGEIGLPEKPLAQNVIDQVLQEDEWKGFSVSEVAKVTPRGYFQEPISASEFSRYFGQHITMYEVNFPQDQNQPTPDMGGNQAMAGEKAGNQGSGVRGQETEDTSGTGQIITTHEFSQPFQLTIIAPSEKFHGEATDKLKCLLEEKGLLKSVSYSSAKFDHEKEQRIIYTGGHCDACINNSIQGSFSAAKNYGLKLEVLLPLDQIYIGPEDFEGNEKEAIALKRQYAQRLKESLLTMAGPAVNWAMYWDEETLHVQKDLPNDPVTIVIRFYTHTSFMIERFPDHTKDGTAPSLPLLSDLQKEKALGGIDFTSEGIPLNAQGERIDFAMPADLENLRPRIF